MDTFIDLPNQSDTCPEEGHRVTRYQTHTEEPEESYTIYRYEREPEADRD